MNTELSQFDVRWSSPGKTDRSGMPFGNGETAAMVWTTSDGKLQFYISRTDSLNENDNNDKIAKIVLSLSPNPFKKGTPFSQVLHIEQGRISVEAGTPGKKIALEIWMDSEIQTMYVSGTSEIPYILTASYRVWRTAARPILTDGFPADEQVYIAADKQLVKDGQSVVYHANGNTNLRAYARVASVSDELNTASDYLSGRIYGCALRLSGSRVSGNALTKTGTEFLLTASTESLQGLTEEAFVEKLLEANTDLPSAAESKERTADWWKEYFAKSYIFVEGDTPRLPKVTAEIALCKKERYPADGFSGSAVTRAYVLTKFMTECTARGSQPIRFNGLQFNTLPGGKKPIDFRHFAKSLTKKPLEEPTLKVNPDDRPWGELTLWQNIRLPYMSMLARGEIEELKCLFRFYAGHREINRALAKNLYGADGQFNTEITHTSGLLHGGIYGFDRTGKAPGYAENRWGGAVDISPGLELITLMFEYVRYTEDLEFLQTDILPYAKELMMFIETRFKQRNQGKICLTPLHAVETYWDTLNPITVVAGMRAVLEAILELPEQLVKDREYFAEMLEKTPDIATEERGGKTVFAPAEKYEAVRNNVEPVEMYMIFPYKLCSATKPMAALAQDTYDYCKAYGNFRARVIGEAPNVPCYSGWQYVGISAAMLNRSEEAAEVLEHNCSLKNPGYRFPAMWGPAYDSVPDGDHAANLMNQLQYMLLRAEGDKLYLLPAWKKEWNAAFKLYAPKNTVIEGKYENGSLDFTVTPEYRAKDVVLPEWML